MGKDHFDFLFGCGQKDITENVVLTPFIPLNRFVSGNEQKISFNGRLYSGLILSAKTGVFTVIKCGLGASVAADCLAFLDDTRARNVIYAGSCAGVNDACIGDVILCDEASDGTGYFNYAGKRTDIDKILKDAVPFRAAPGMVECLSKNPDIKKGSVFTIGSLVAETAENIEQIRDKGFKGIDMEIAAVYNAAETAGIAAAGLLFVSDIPSRRPFWETLEGDDREQYRKGMNRVVKLSVEWARCS
jgi:nucleoside phosphorylase